MANLKNANFVTLYTTTAHVFQVDPETKNSWLQKGKSSIPVSFLASIPANNNSQDSSSGERELKIISVASNGETVLDSTILSKTIFKELTPKFGQWHDHTGTTYGLGFDSEAELTEFVEMFQQLQREILRRPATQHHTMPLSNNANSSSQISSSQANGRQMSGLLNQQQLNHVSETNGGYPETRKGSVSSMQQYSNTLSHPGHQQMRRQQQQLQPQVQNISQSNGDLSLNNGCDERSINNINAADHSLRGQHMFLGQNNSANNSSINSNVNNNNSLNASGRVSPETENSPQSEWQVREQLRYENETLKRALEESSKNAGMWHNELVNLRTNNVKLTQALQESKANVEEWERELSSLRDENKELKLLLALESAKDPEKSNEYKKDLQKYKDYVDEVQDQLRKKENELEELQRSMEKLELKAQSSGNHDDSKSSSQFAIAAQQKPKLDIISAKLEAKIGELFGIQREFSQLVDKLHH